MQCLAPGTRLPSAAVAQVILPVQPFFVMRSNTQYCYCSVEKRDFAFPPQNNCAWQLCMAIGVSVNALALESSPSINELMVSVSGKHPSLEASIVSMLDGFSFSIAFLEWVSYIFQVIGMK